MNRLEKPHIAVVGGGTGSFTLLQEFKKLTPNISAIVNMSDDGGSTGILRDELGVLPPGDVRQCLVALSNNLERRDMFNQRDERGHALGNLALADLELKHNGDFMRAVEDASSELDITGKVIPVTTDRHILAMRDGAEVVRGEFTIGSRAIKRRDARVFHEPPTSIRPEAKQALMDADMITIAPGNLYGSLLAALSTGGVREALQTSKAPKVMVANLVNKPGQTDNWHVADYVEAIEEYVGEVDQVLYNTKLPAPDLLLQYAAEGELPVRICDEEMRKLGSRAVGLELVADNMFIQDKNDKLIRRTLIRHNAGRVGEYIMSLLGTRKNTINRDASAL